MSNEHLRCDTVIDHLLDYISNELPPEFQAGAERHLAACPAWVEYLRTYQATMVVEKAAYLDELGDHPPEELIGRILKQRR